MDTAADDVVDTIAYKVHEDADVMTSSSHDHADVMLRRDEVDTIAYRLHGPPAAATTNAVAVEMLNV